MAERTIGPFQIEKRLGTGGMGVVYLATYTKNGRKVALKVLSPNVTSNPKVVARFDREMDILKRLRHPSIVRYYGGDKQGVQRFYAMEFMSGGTLDDELKREGSLHWERVVDVALEVCSALEHAHAAGVVHRDLKPGNVFLSSRGHVKLGDFGIARDSEATALTEAGKTVGTYAYMAPEQITGKPPVSHKTDLYALGCVMFQMLTGKPPFEANTAAEMLFKHIEEEPPRLRNLTQDCPIWLESLILRLLAKDPADRPYDALATKSALEEVRMKVASGASVAGATVSGGPTQLTVSGDKSEVERLVKGRKKRKKRKRQPVFEQTWFLATALGLVVAFIAWGLWPASEDELFAEAEGNWRGVAAAVQSGEKLDEDGTGSIYDTKIAIEKLLERYPEGEHAETASGWLSQLEMYQAERRAVTRMTANQAPKSEAERLFVDALRYERFEDRITAIEKFESMIRLLADREEDRVYVDLARSHAGRLRSEVGDTDRVTIVDHKLAEADRLYEDGKTLKAHNIWNSIVTLYALDKELEPQVRRAQARLEGERPEDEPAGES